MKHIKEFGLNENNMDMESNEETVQEIQEKVKAFLDGLKEEYKDSIMDISSKGYDTYMDVQILFHGYRRKVLPRYDKNYNPSYGSKPFPR